MKKKLFFLIMMGFLAACTQNITNETDEFIQRGNVESETVYLTPQEVEFKPAEEVEALRTIQEIPPQKQEEMSSERLAKKLRKGLRSTGIQIKEVSGQIDLIIPNQVAFGGNQFKFQRKFEETMTEIVGLLKEYEQMMIQIIGYTDDSGSVLANKELSLKKADMIAEFLIKNTISPQRIITDGAGGDNPVANNTTPEGREKNRRIEMTLISLY